MKTMDTQKPIQLKGASKMFFEITSCRNHYHLSSLAASLLLLHGRRVNFVMG